MSMPGGRAAVAAAADPLYRAQYSGHWIKNNEHPMIDLDVAAAWHRMFALHLEMALEGLDRGGYDMAAVCDGERCELGRWLAEEPGAMAGLPAYRELADCHRQFHETACRMVALFEAQHLEEAQALRTTAFLPALAALQQAIAAIGAVLRRSPAWPADGDALWDDALLIGVPIIDEQHRALARLVARLRDRPADDMHSESVIDVLTAVGELIALHFDTEELLLGRCGLSAAEVGSHVAAHNAMLHQIAQINLDSLGGRAASAREIFETLRVWVVDHVILHDFQLRGRVPAGTVI